MSANRNESTGGFIKLASRYYTNSKRLLFKSTRKPSGQELKVTSRIVAIGIVVIGAVGFIIDQILNLTFEAINP
ncbi:MAG: preprotein translocase subunit SecE [Candidatus Heimdallarchaeota archaeon]|nr:preprotein translocase subunit SecE [Candidatus Heimdallarchaeota archaeon]